MLDDSFFTICGPRCHPNRFHDQFPVCFHRLEHPADTTAALPGSLSLQRRRNTTIIVAAAAGWLASPRGVIADRQRDRSGLFALGRTVVQPGIEDAEL